MSFASIHRALFAAAALGMCVATASAAEPVDFNRDIRPLLSSHCFQCHGPDEGERQGELRLDTQEGAFAAREGAKAAIAPGDAAASELYLRITAADPAERMPPPDTGRSLTPEQITLFKRWIEEGAEWRGHWSFSPPGRPAIPAIVNAANANAIDAFIDERLAREGIAPTGEASKATLIRRATLDLTGLPPTLDEVDAFLADNSPSAYERVIDRLLASPAYGERMAAIWLDLARYADTAGYQTDGDRQMFRWRDWVIEAFNRDMPFDQFTIEQLAGDLLPSPTLSQLIATGFNRNHRANSEGGIVFEEYLLEYAVDRLDTTATVWLGLTLGCARCHDHKYDPLTQRDFYGSLAYFNQVPERGRVIKYGNSPPLIASPTDKQARELATIDGLLQEAEEQLTAQAPELERAQIAWELSLPADVDDNWTIENGLAARYAFENGLENSGDAELLAAAVAAIDKAASSAAALAAGSKPKPPSEASFMQGEPAFENGAASFDGRRYIEAAGVAPFTGADKFSFAAWVQFAGDASSPQPASILSLMDDDDARDKGISLFVAGGRLHFFIGPRWLDDGLRLVSQESLPSDAWRHIAVTYDGSQMAAGVKVYLDGRPAPMETQFDLFTGTFPSPSNFRIGAHGANHETTDSAFVGLIDDVRFYRRELSPDEAAAIACRQNVREIAAIPRSERTLAQSQYLASYYLAHDAPPATRELLAHRQELRDRRAAFVATIPTTMIMQDRPDLRETFILHRGEYDKPKEKVSRATPASLPPLPEGAPNDRLGFARWLVDGRHPLTARVAVNRLWEMMFGAGLVRTTEDFGSQGEWPTHPELLDHLAVEFSQGGWDMKRLLREIAISAAYRRSSPASGEAKALDPDNRWLGRASRLRLGAEAIRDQALAAGGLLARPIGGPSVKPRQPEGLWEELATDPYIPDTGESLYRRGLYTFWKRTIPPPAMTTFDATSRESCTVRRSRTNTPLQALALLNDETYVEAARGLAARMRSQGGVLEERLAIGFRLVLARSPSPRESELLAAGWYRKREHYASHPKEARSLLMVGEEDEEYLAERAADVAMASVILNLDEAITRE